MKTLYYKGQPVRVKGTWENNVQIITDIYSNEAHPILLNDGEGFSEEEIEVVAHLPNTWLQWHGGSEPPCDGKQKVFIQDVTGDIVYYRCAENVLWRMVEWYMMIKPPEVLNEND